MTGPFLIGRSREQEELAALADGSTGTGMALRIEGDPGIGKSALLSDCAARARNENLTVVRANGVGTESHMPYAGLCQLLRPLSKHIPILPARQRSALRATFGEDEEEGRPPELFLVALATLTLLTELASTAPVLAVIDDGQWLDQPTEQVLAFVSRRIQDDPIRLVVAVRPGYTGALTDPAIRSMWLGPLADADARALLRASADDLTDAEHELIVAASQGNPLALVELPAGLRARSAPVLDGGEIPLTARLESAFASRLGALPQMSRLVMTAAAVDSSEDLAEILAAATALAGVQPGADDLAALGSADLVRIDGARLMFRHPLVRSAVTSLVTPGSMQDAHAAWATVLDHQPFRRALHRSQAVLGRDDEVADELEAAHTVPLRLGSPIIAARTLERSAQLTRDPRRRHTRRLLAAQHAFTAGRVDLVRDLLSKLAADSTDGVMILQIRALQEQLSLGERGDAQKVEGLRNDALAALQAGQGSVAIGLLFGAAVRCWFNDPGPELRAAVAAAADQVRERVPALGQHPVFPAILGFAEPVLRAREVVELIARAGQTDDALALRVLGSAAHAVGDGVTTIDLLGRSTTLLREQGALGVMLESLTTQLPNLLEAGDWNHMAEVLDEAQRHAHDTGQGKWGLAARLLIGQLHALRGDNETAQRLAAEGERDMTGLRKVRACAQLVRGMGWMGVGDYPNALEVLVRLFDPDDATFHLMDRYHGIAFLTEAAVRTGQADRARVIVDRLATELGPNLASTPAVHLQYSHAVLAPEAEAERLYRDALDGAAGQWPWHRARLQLEFGRWLRRQRRVIEARGHLLAAYAAFQVIGATSWTEQARVELRAAGGRLPHTDSPEVADLSPQERQIARMAAEGLSNKEIGARLYLSSRTIGSHLYRIFPKLGVTSRGQLAGRLGPPS